MQPTKFALRFLLPAEIIMGLFTAVWGLAGIAGTGRLSNIVAQMGANHIWVLCLVIIGLIQAIAAMAELYAGRDWTDLQLHYAAEARHFAAFLNMMIWVVVVGMFLLHAPIRASTALAGHSVILIVGNGLIAYHTRRLAVLLDPAIQTTNLRKKLVEARIIRG